MKALVLSILLATSAAAGAIETTNGLIVFWQPVCDNYKSQHERLGIKNNHAFRLYKSVMLSSGLTATESSNLWWAVKTAQQEQEQDYQLRELKRIVKAQKNFNLAIVASAIVVMVAWIIKKEMSCRAR